MAKKNDKNKNNEKNVDKKQQRRSPYMPPGQGMGIWRIVLIVLLLWLLISYLMQPFVKTDQTEISYSEFKQQVRKQNVVSVTFEGQKINGEFKGKYLVVEKAGEDSSRYQYFNTVKPDVEDSKIMNMLENNNVTINAKEQDKSWLPYLLITLIPFILIIGYLVYVRKKMQGQMKGMGGGGLFGIGKSKAKKYSRSMSDIGYEDVAGLENAKRDLREIIEYLKEPEKFTALGADIPKGILLMGPPGTGKTLLARATAGEADVPFYSISGSEFIEMFVGVGASRVRDLFETAKKDAPAIIFVDEIDSVGRARGAGLGGGHDEREQTLNQILNEMDGFEPNQSVVVMAATNRPDVLDSALTRPGRFDRQVTLELPQKKAREKILQIHTRNIPISDEVNLENFAARTVGFSGADLKNLVNEAALLAGRRDKSEVEIEDFEQARDKIMLGAEREEMIEDKEKRLIAYHESGHALVAKLLSDTDPLQKVTIIPRGRALGATEQTPETDRHNYNKQYLLNRIAVTLGGRAAEDLIFGELTNGAANDLKTVTRIARKMVCQWGMSERVGPVYVNQGEEHVFLGREMTQQKDYSDHTAKVVDEEIQKIITDMENKAKQLLKNNKEKLEAIANSLLENETLENDEIDKILAQLSKKGTKKKSQKKEKSSEKVKDEN